MHRGGDKPGKRAWQKKLFEIIFESDTSRGKLFDVYLLCAIAASTAAVMLESIESVRMVYESVFRHAEWLFTAAFTAEYIVRLAIVKKPLRYAGSFLGVVDFLAVLPAYLSLLVLNTTYLRVIRAIRLLRIFRVFKLGHYITEGNLIVQALKAARPKITVFLGGVGVLVLIMGTIMYMIEGAASGFTSIPRSIYWAIVTITTVGYGDISPVTVPGQILASVIMVMGYSIIAVPTGLVTAEIGRLRSIPSKKRVCPGCKSGTHDSDAVFCKICGFALN